MTHDDWLHLQADRSLRRLWPILETELAGAAATPDECAAFERRLRGEWPRLFQLFFGLYGEQYDFFFHLGELMRTVTRSWAARPAPLKALDARREAEPEWFQSQTMMGGVLYVDRYAGTLAGLRDHLPYFEELGLTYLHLMPLFAAPEGNSDGGYAVSSYRDVDPRLGTMADLADLATALRERGISLVVDFVFNHTSDEHEWARQAQAGDPEAEEFYLIFPDRAGPDAYERTLREIFPAVRRGSFTWRDDMRRWVWTTFNSFQWDLNYSNPAVFRAMADEMLFLANVGVEFLRLDAVAFIWKRLGTSSESQPEAHHIIQAFNALARIAAPALGFKSEAIVHPAEVLSYIGPDECQISYNPLLMALLWEALATRETKLLSESLRSHWRIPPGCAWVNYLRSHDDIGWTFDDADAQRLGMNPFDHRQFLNRFFVGRFDGSFAQGVPFQENPATGDARVSGTLASLAGLEQALATGDPLQQEMALRRIVLLHSIILSIGGIPLLYLGDELGTTNDYSYERVPAHADDSRWVHRPARDSQRLARRHDPATVEGRLFGELTRLIELRKSLPVLAGNDMTVWETHNPHLFAFLRQHEDDWLLVVANFSEAEQTLRAEVLQGLGIAASLRDVIGGGTVVVDEGLRLEAYGFVWLRVG